MTEEELVTQGDEAEQLLASPAFNALIAKPWANSGSIWRIAATPICSSNLTPILQIHARRLQWAAALTKPHQPSSGHGINAGISPRHATAPI